MTFETTLATNLYGATRAAGAPLTPDGKETQAPSFSQALTEAARLMETTLRQSEAASEAALSGEGDVQSLVEALAATELALETAVTIRDKVVEAYQEVLRMPV